jgi:hypothetical protein
MNTYRLLLSIRALLVYGACVRWMSTSCSHKESGLGKNISLAGRSNEDG